MDNSGRDNCDRDNGDWCNSKKTNTESEVILQKQRNIFHFSVFFYGNTSEKKKIYKFLQIMIPAFGWSHSKGRFILVLS
jgi:hypothetical protein